MYFNGEHICKSPQPFDATTFDLKTAPPKQSFDGEFQLIIQADDADDRIKGHIQTTYKIIKQTEVRIAVLIEKNRQRAVEPLEMVPTFDQQVNHAFCLIIVEDHHIYFIAENV